MEKLPNIPSRVALHVRGDNRWFGHGAQSELLGNETYTGLVAMAATGKRPTKHQREVLDIVAAVMTSADGRIWPLKLTRLVSSYGRTLVGFAAGHLAMEGKVIGPWMPGYAAFMLAEASAAATGSCPDLDAACVDRALKSFLGSRERLYGYGVPLRPSDERMDALTAYVAERPELGGRYWRIQERMSALVKESRGFSPNIGVGVAALLLDAGYEPKDVSPLVTFLNGNVFMAHALEAAAQRNETMRELPDDRVEYVGAPARKSPRAAVL